MSETHTLTVDAAQAGQRLDKFLCSQLSGMSRARLQALVLEGCVTCDGQALSDNAAKVKNGQVITVTIPEVAASHITAQDIPLDIVYEDEHLLVISKPAGLTVHPAPGHWDSTLVNALLAHCGDSLSGIGGVARPGIVHRIDKDTSGLLAVAKHDAAHQALAEQLQARTMKRTYLALVWGTPRPAKGTLTGNIGRSPRNRKKMTVLKTGGKEATTHYKILQTFLLGTNREQEARSVDRASLEPASCEMQQHFTEAKKHPRPLPPRGGAISLLECQLETGRTHQIRVHFAHAGHGLVGDPVYGQPTAARIKSLRLPDAIQDVLTGFTRQALHATALELTHPKTNEAMQFSCVLPQDMQHLCDMLATVKKD